jgi:hypothetical protein
MSNAMLQRIAELLVRNISQPKNEGLISQLRAEWNRNMTLAYTCDSPKGCPRELIFPHRDSQPPLAATEAKIKELLQAKALGPENKKLSHVNISVNKWADLTRPGFLNEFMTEFDIKPANLSVTRNTNALPRKGYVCNLRASSSQLSSEHNNDQQDSKIRKTELRSNN